MLSLATFKRPGFQMSKNRFALGVAGKSTLLRQVCLAALMAQAGAWVPADSLEMTPVDAIFVRMGARDAIMSGQVQL